MKTKTRTKTINVQPQYRTALLEVRQSENTDEELVADLTFSSDEPVERMTWFDDMFFEVLDHSAGSVRMDRIRGAGPLLMDHNPRRQIGVVDSADIADGRGRATVRFSRNARNHPEFGDIWQDVQDGIRRSVSVGYRVHKAVMDEERDDGPDTIRITDWEPFEVSLVSIPADMSVGIGRAEEPDARPNTLTLEIRSSEVEDMTTGKRKDQNPGSTPDEPEATPAPDGGNGGGGDAGGAAAPRNADVHVVEDRARAAERKRIDRIDAATRTFVERMHMPADQVQAARDKAVSEGIDPQDYFHDVMDRIASKAGSVSPATETPAIGMNAREVQRWSLFNAIRYLANPTDRRAAEAAAFELEASQAAADHLQREAQGLLIPPEVLTQRIWQSPRLARRDLSKTLSGATGDNLVEDRLLAGSFIDLLRARLVFSDMGIMVMDDLVGDLSIPRATGSATAYWVAEAGDITESEQAYDQVALTPHSVGAFTDITRRLLKQSTPAAEGLVMDDLSRVLGLEIERVLIEGDPDTTATQYEPRGVLNTSGIGSVSQGAAGGAPDYDMLVDLEGEVATDNADVGNLRYLTNSSVRKILRKTRMDTGSGRFVWPPNANDLLGYPAHVTNQVPSDLTESSSTGLSAALFGNWSDLILAMWSGLDMLVDPYTLGKSGGLRIIVMQDVDSAVRHAESFAAAQDIVTTG